MGAGASSSDGVTFDSSATVEIRLPVRVGPAAVTSGGAGSGGGGGGGGDVAALKKEVARLAGLLKTHHIADPLDNPKPLGSGPPKKPEHASLGVIRLDYDYPPAPGDIDHPGSYDYDVFYRVVPGLTFEMCQAGKMTREVEAEFVEAIKWLDAQGVEGITGDCGFMMWFQSLARAYTHKPVFMSSLVHLPALTCAFNVTEKVAIFTANSETLTPMKDLIKDECGVEADEERYVFVGCQDVPGFEAVAAGGKVDVEAVTPGMVAKAKAVMAEHPTLRCILMECTELPPYSDALRHATGLPVFDAITCCDFFIGGVTDNPRFGLNDWHSKWDGKQEEYTFGENLDAEDKTKTANAVKAEKKDDGMLSSVERKKKKELQLAKTTNKPPPAKAKGEKMNIFDEKRTRNKASAASLGVVRLDYEYPPAPGDIDSPDSYAYDVFYRVVPGLTFEMCQSGKLTPEVEAEFVEAVKYFEEKNVSGITGDCGFMMWFQELARKTTHKPVFMSALAQLPAITAAFGQMEQVAIFTANSATLTPMNGLIKDECGVNPDEERFIIVGCQDVPGFEAVALGEKVDVAAVTPGMVAKCRKVLQQYPKIRAILMECTELPPYSDALRANFGLPVYDAISCCDLFIDGVTDNPNFGIDGWQHEWDGKQDKYEFGQNLDAADKAKTVNLQK